MSATFALMSAPTTYVVQNDTAKADNAIPTTSKHQTATKLSEMETKRKQWETTAYRTSNQQLYAVLADCLAYGETLPIAEAKQRTKDLEEFFKLRGYVVKSDSPLFSRIVKAVFGAVDRRRLSTYSLVLREASKQGIKATQLAEWIEQNCGIQEIRLSQSATFIKPAAKVEIAKQQFDTLPELASVKSEALSLLADGDFMGECCVLIAEQAANGSFVVRGLTRADGAVNAAFAALYAAQKKAA
jgi:hypothetical protein